MKTYSKPIKFIDHAKALWFSPPKPARRRASDALSRVRAARDAGDEPTNTTGYSPQPSFNQQRMPAGYELVQKLPRDGGTYFVQTTAAGDVELWRIPAPFVPDMTGVVGPSAIATRPPGQVVQVPDVTPRGPIARLPAANPSGGVPLATNWTTEAWANPRSIGDVPLVGDRRMTRAQGRAMTPGTRAGLAAAAEVRRTSDQLRAMNERNAAFWGRGR